MRLTSIFTFALLSVGACDCASGVAPGSDVGGGDDTSTMADRTVPVGDEDPICDNGFDDDDDGFVDENCGCTPGTRQNCYIGDDTSLAGIGACLYGIQRCETDFEFSTWGECVGYGGPSTETCDRVDNNCDGEIDEGCGCTVGEVRDCYSGPEGTGGVGICVSGFERCIDRGPGPTWDSCASSVEPGVEDCDGGDEDCDGRIDEDCSCTSGDTRDCYGGPPDTRGRGACGSGRQTCSGDAWGECLGDTTPVAEVCDGGIDEDCDGLVDCDDDDCDCCTSYREVVSIEPEEGEILFVVDRSGSMLWPAVGTSASRWSELQDAMGATLPMVSDSPLGLMTFPELDGSDERLNCSVASSPDVPLASGNSGAVQSRLSSAMPRAGDTPTPDAFSTVRSYLGGRSTSREPFVILMTDGLPEPNCGATVPATVDAIAQLQRDGTDTFVVGFVGPDRSGDTSGIPALRDALNQFAAAGGRPRSGARQYYEAVDGAELTTAIRAILGEATECRFALPSEPPAGAVVRQDGAVVPTSGYTLSGRQIEFTGPYCARIRAGLIASIVISVDC